MAKVEMYTKTVCPYCVKAKNLLKQKGVDVTEYNLSENRNCWKKCRNVIPAPAPFRKFSSMINPSAAVTSCMRWMPKAA